MFFEEYPNLICSGFLIFLFATRSKNDNPSNGFTRFFVLVFKNNDFFRNHVFSWNTIKCWPCWHFNEKSHQKTKKNQKCANKNPHGLRCHPRGSVQKTQKRRKSDCIYRFWKTWFSDPRLGRKIMTGNLYHLNFLLFN